MLVISVGFLHARSGATIALMTGRTAELVRIVNLQQLRLGMAGESIGIFVGLLVALRHHRGGSDLQRLACIEVAGFATVDYVGIGDVDLDDLRIPVSDLALETVDLLRRQVDHVVGDVFVHLGLSRRDRFQHFAELQAQLRALVADLVVFFFELRESVFLFAAVGIFDGGLLILILINFFSLAGLGGIAGAGFVFVGKRVHVGAAVGEYALNGEQAGTGIVEFSARLIGLRFRILISFVVRLLESDVVPILLNIFLRSFRLRSRSI